MIYLVKRRKRVILGRKSNKAAFYILRILDSDKKHSISSCRELEASVLLLCKGDKRAANTFGFSNGEFVNHSWLFKYTLTRLREEGLVEFENHFVGDEKWK